MRTGCLVAVVLAFAVGLFVQGVPHNLIARIGGPEDWKIRAALQRTIEQDAVLSPAALARQLGLESGDLCFIDETGYEGLLEFGMFHTSTRSSLTRCHSVRCPVLDAIAPDRIVPFRTSVYVVGIVESCDAPVRVGRIFDSRQVIAIEALERARGSADLVFSICDFQQCQPSDGEPHSPSNSAVER